MNSIRIEVPEVHAESDYAKKLFDMLFGRIDIRIDPSDVEYMGELQEELDAASTAYTC